MWRLVLVLALVSGCVPRGLVAEARDRDRDGHDAWQLGGDDCDDAAPAVHPGAEEACGNDRDDDCDGDVDEDGLGASTWYQDVDRDGYGATGQARDACAQPPGFAAVGGDCDDAITAVNPGADEVCGNDRDDDCDGATDDAGVGATAWYRDADGDGHGDLDDRVEACEAPQGYVASADDCDDGAGVVHPGATEVCNNGVDDNCDASASPCELRGVIGLGTADVKIRGTRAHQRLGTSVAVGRLDANDWPDLLIGAGFWAGSASSQPEVYALTSPLDTPEGIPASSLPAPVLVPIEDGPSDFAADLTPCDVDRDGLDEVLSAWTEGEWDSPWPTPVGVRVTRLEASHVLNGDWPPATSTTALSGALPALLGRMLCAPAATVPSVVVRESGSTPRLVGFRDFRGAGLQPDDADWQLVPTTSATPNPIAYEDLDGDGRNDVVFGLPGVVAAIADDEDGIRSESGAWLTLDVPGGGTAAAVGDIDGDGVKDVLVVADGDSGKAVFGFLGPFMAGAPLEQTGAAFSFASRPGAPVEAVGLVGDLNGDGIEDWCARASGDDRSDVDAGSIYCWYGGPRLLGGGSVEDADLWLTGEGAADGTASTWSAPADRPRIVRGIDVNRDGHDDLVVGAPHVDLSALADAGSVYVLWGRGL